MTRQSISRGVIAVVLLLAASVSHAAPVKWDTGPGANGHFYEAIPTSGFTWEQARDAASQMFLNGVQGHLATITSAEENAFIFGNLPINSTAYWLGADQPPCSPEPTCGWRWVTGESFSYTAWAGGEPNNSGGTEDALAVAFFQANTWNDAPRGYQYAPPASGYVVEYDGVVTATDCQTTGGCNPSGVQQVVLPPSLVLQPGDTLTQTLVENPTGPTGQVQYLDPRVDAFGQCTDRRSLDVFREVGSFPSSMYGQLILPVYLCGSPRFAIVKSVATFQVQQDVIRSEQQPEQVFAGDIFGCAGDALPGLFYEDLQRRGVFAWQPDDKAKVLERRAIELTNGCGSSRGATPSASWFVLNLHIDCGIPFGSNDTGVRVCFRVLTQTNFAALQLSLLQARRSISSPRYVQLAAPLTGANLAFLAGNYALAVERLNTFIDRVNTGTFILGNFNHQGNLLARAETIRFTIDAKLDPPVTPPVP